MKELELRKYVNNSNITPTEEEVKAYKKSLQYLEEDGKDYKATMEHMQNAVNATVTNERKRLKVFLSLVDKTRLTLSIKDCEELDKYFNRNLNSEEKNKALDTLKSVYELFIEQDKSISDQIDTILAEIDKTKNYDLISEVDSLSNLITNQNTKSKYRSLYLIYKADSVKEKNTSAAYDFLNAATDYINVVSDNTISSMLRIKQAAVRRKIDTIKKENDNPVKTIDPPKNNNDETIKKINELLDKAEKDLDDKALEEACELIKTLPESEEKNKLTKRAHDILEKIKANDAKLENARKAVEKAEAMGNKFPVEKGAKQAIKEAYDEVNLLDNCQGKTSLLERLDNLVVSMSKKFMEELDRLQNKVYEYFNSVEDYEYKSEAEEIPEEEITNLKDLYAELYKDKIEEINFDKNGKSGCGIKLNYLITEYNSQAQTYYQQNKVFEKTGKKGTKIKLPFSLKQRLIEAGPHFISDAVKKGYKYKIVRDNKKLEKYKSDDYKKSNKDKKIEKYEKKYQKDLQVIREHDEICNVPLMMSKNKLEKLKETLYKKGALGLDEKQSKKYQKSVNGISKILLKGLTKITKDKEVSSDPLRAKTIINQYLELLCVAPEKAKLKLKWYKKKEEVSVFEKTKADALKFIRDSFESGSITKEDSDSYMFMIENIEFYRIQNDYAIYEMFSDKDANGIENYVDLNNAKKYYEDPIKYKNIDEENNEIEETVDYILPKRK